MKVGDKKFYKVIQSLGRLKACEIEAKDVASSMFGMKVTQTDHDSDYGTNDYYQIELFHNGNYCDFSIAPNTYSYLIKNHTKWIASYREWKNWFTIDFSNGKEVKSFEYNSALYSFEDGLCEIVYILILLSVVDDIAKLHAIYYFIFRANSKSGTLGERIDLYKEVKEISENLKNRYPFICYPINAALEQRLKEIKSDLLKEALVDNALL